MPLKRDPNLAVLRRHGTDLIFTMLNSSGPVTCRMSGSVISAYANSHYGMTPEEIFRKERDLVEKAASRKYDDGESEPCVRLTDLLAGPT